MEALSSHPRRVVSYAVDPSDDWILEDDKVPESNPHDMLETERAEKEALLRKLRELEGKR